MKKAALNNQGFGALLGLLLPFLGIVVFYLWNTHRFETLDEFFAFLSIADVLPKVISLSVLPNLLAFFVFTRINYLRSARGVLLSTLIIGFVMLLIRMG